MTTADENACAKLIVSYGGARPAPAALVAQQAKQAAELVRRLNQPASVVLRDPVGTGKTVVALAAAARLLVRQKVDHVLVVTPNATVAEIWEERALRLGGFGTVRGAALLPGQAAILEAKRRWKPSELRVVTRKRLPHVPKPRRPYLLIVDEAHRGLVEAFGNTHSRLVNWGGGSRVMLVTATPYQLSIAALLTMLRIGGPDRPAEEQAIRDYGAAIVRLAHACRGLEEDPSDLIAAEAERRRDDALALKDDAVAALSGRIAPEMSRSAIGVPDPPPPRHDPVPDGRWAGSAVRWREAFDVARVVPELVSHGKGDMFHRRLVSCTEAFWNGAAVKDPENGLLAREASDGRLAPFVKQLREALGTGTDHPKVRATVDWVVERARAERHVLVYCVFDETRQTIADAVKAEIGPEWVYEAKGDGLPKKIKDRFRDRTDDVLVLVVQDRFSESIDLDGGEPCLVHHDLPWNPARLRQRWGRIVRASSGFAPVKATDIFIPVLDVETDRRLFETVTRRARIGEAFLPGGAGSGDEDDPASGAIPDDYLRQLAV